MTIAREAIYALHKRLKELSVNAPADQLAYLAKALESISGRSTVHDIINISDEKLQELLNGTNSHLESLNTTKATALSAIDSAKVSSINVINTNKETSLTELERAITSNLSLIDTRKDDSIAAINTNKETSLTELETATTNNLSLIDARKENIIATINDRFENFTPGSTVGNRNIIQNGALPFIFAILSIDNDQWGYSSNIRSKRSSGEDVVEDLSFLLRSTGRIRTSKARRELF